MAGFAAWIGGNAALPLERPAHIEPEQTERAELVQRVFVAPERAPLAATYSKLRSGAWGVRTEGDHTPSKGELVEVLTRAGKRKGEEIGRVLWTDGRISICAIIPRW